MKKSIKGGIVAAVAVAAVFAAYQSYGSYGLQDNGLLMQNVEALAEVPEGSTSGDPNGGSFRYPDKTGNAKFCTLYYYIDASGKIAYSSTEDSKQFELSGKYEKRVTEGLKDRCPDSGKGCNPYSCQEVKY